MNENDKLAELIKNLDGSEEYERADALEKIGRMAEKGVDVSGAVPKLVRMLDREKSADVVEQLNLTLIKIGEPAIEELNKALDNPNPLVKATVAEIVGGMAEKRVDVSTCMPKLVKLLGENNPIVRREAILALSSIIKNSPKDVDGLLLDDVKIKPPKSNKQSTKRGIRLNLR